MEVIEGMTEKIAEATGGKPAEWIVSCSKCGTKIEDIFCTPREIASIIINEQRRKRCIGKSTHDFAVGALLSGKSIFVGKVICCKVAIS